MSIASILITLLGIIAFLFVFWKRLSEDYTSNQIFSVAFFALFGSLIFFCLTKFLLLSKVEFQEIQPSGIMFWASLVGGLIGYTLGIFRYNLRLFESLEALGIGLMYIVLSVFVADAFLSLSVVSLIAGTVVALLILLFYFLDSRYKDFSWYKSGKVGFSGLTATGLFFLTRAIVALFFPFVLSFLGRIETLFSGILTFIIFLAVYNLSQQN